MSFIVVTCTFPDEAAALAAAREAVNSGLAACCQIGPAIRSLYRWKGQVEESQEVLLTCKTLGSSWPALRDLLQKMHPYEVPEIIVLPISTGLPAYLDWIGANATPFPKSGAAPPADHSS